MHGREVAYAEPCQMSLSNKQLLALLGLKDGEAGATLGQRPSARIRIIGQSGGPQPPPRPDTDRRSTPRFTPGETGWSGEAVIRPGTSVRIIDIARTGALNELTVIGPSEVDSFNNAAFNALAMSNPADQLPADYPSDRLFITVTFYYNETPPSQ